MIDLAAFFCQRKPCTSPLAQAQTQALFKVAHLQIADGDIHRTCLLKNRQRLTAITGLKHFIGPQAAFATITGLAPEQQLGALFFVSLFFGTRSRLLVGWRTMMG